MIEALTIAVGIWLGGLFLGATVWVGCKISELVRDYQRKRYLGFSRRHALGW